MKLKKIIINNYNLYQLPLIFVGIYWISFIFGWSGFFNIDLYRLPIFFNGILIFILTFLIQYFFFLIFKKNKFLFNLFDKIIHTLIFGYLFFFIIKFADINLHYILKKIGLFEYNIQFYLYSIPFIIGILIHLIIDKKKKWYNFLGILILLLVIATSFRIFFFIKPEIKLSKSNFYSDIDISKNDISMKKNPKVILLIFDEFDFNILIENIKKFPSIEKLINNSFFHKNFYPPGKFTSHSISSMLLGKEIGNIKFQSGDLYLIDENEKKFSIKTKNTLFHDLNDKNLKSSIFGQYYPYCSKIIVENCIDTLNLEEIKISFKESLEILLNQIYLDKFVNVNLIIQRLFLNTNNLENESKVSQQDEIKIIDPTSKKMIQLSNNFINSNSDLIFIHYPFPHLGKKVIFREENLYKESDYIQNMYLVEMLLSNLQTSLINSNSLLIITSDHWFRESNLEKNLKDYKTKSKRIPFIAKILNDNNYFEITKDGNSVSIREFINSYFDGEITSNKNILEFYENQKKYKIFF